jgi:hypothetical protein
MRTTGVIAMFGWLRPHGLLTLGLLLMAMLLSGCVVYPGYGYYGGGYGAPYYGGGVVAFDGGWGWHRGWHHRDWDR